MFVINRYILYSQLPKKCTCVPSPYRTCTGKHVSVFLYSCVARRTNGFLPLVYVKDINNVLKQMYRYRPSVVFFVSLTVHTCHTKEREEIEEEGEK